MSISEVERFSKDLATNPELQAQAKQHAAGLASIVAFGKENGYDFSLDDAKNYIRTRTTHELDDTQLDQLAGGVKGVTATQTNVVSAAEAVTAAVAVQNAAAATNVAAAAEAVVAGVIVLI